MGVTGGPQTQQDEDQVYDVVIVVEKTANLVPYLEELKTSYLLPTLEYFNGGPPSPIDTGHDYNCTLYCLVTYKSGDSAPELASDCTYPTTSTYELIQSFDNLQFIGGAGQSCSHVSEGLSTALQCLDEIKHLRYSGKPTQRHCILICNSAPYHMVAEESQDYRGYNSEQLASMMGKRGVHLSIISPRKIPALQKLYNEACVGDGFHTHQQAHYAVDPRHLVLLKGFQLQERSISPKVEKDKESNMNVPSPAIMSDQTGGKMDGFKKPINQTVGLQQTSPQQVMQPSPNQIPQSMPMNIQQPNNPQVSLANSSNIPAGMEVMVGGPGMPGQPVGGKPGMMVHVRPQVRRAGLKTGPQGKVQVPAGMGGPPGNLMQPRMRQQQPQPDPNFMMRANMGGGNQNMIGMQPPGVGMSNAGTVGMAPQGTVGMSTPNAMMNQHMQQQIGMTSQANMMVGQVPPNMMGPMQTGGPQNPGMMQPIGVMGGLPQAQPQQQPPQPPPPQPQQPPQQQQYAQQGMPQGFMTGDLQGQNQMANMGPAGNMGQNQQPMVPGPRDRKVIWSGTMEYQDRNIPAPNQRNVTFLLNCNVSVDVQDTDINTVDWPQKLTIQLLPQAMLSSLQHLCKNSRQVCFHFPNNNNNPNPDALRNLYTIMGHGFAGCVRFPAQSEIKIILLMYSAKKKSFIGLIPNDQMGIVQGIKSVVARYRLKQQGVTATVAGVTSSPGAPGMPNTVMAGPVTSASQGTMGGGGMMPSQLNDFGGQNLLTPHPSSQMSMPINTAQPQGSQQTPQQTQQQQTQQQPVQGGDQRRNTNLIIQNIQNDLQANKQRELQFQQQQQQQQSQSVDQKKVIMVSQQQQQQQQPQQQPMQQQQQILEEHMYYPGHYNFYHAQRTKFQQLHAQRLQIQQQQQQQQQQQVANPQLRHLLINQHQRHQQLMMQQMRGGNPQGQPGPVMGPGGQQGMQGAGMGQMGPQPGQNFIEDFNLPEII